MDIMGEGGLGSGLGDWKHAQIWATAKGMQGTVYENCWADFTDSLNEASKKLSQLIAKTWLLHDYPDEYGDYDQVYRFREILLGDLNSSPEVKSKRIKDYFKECNFCHEDLHGALANYLIVVNWSSYRGLLKEGLFFEIPYPPRPSEVTDADLRKWVEDKENQNPTTAYIPLSCAL